MNNSLPLSQLVFKLPGSLHDLTVSFPLRDLPVCQKCKNAFKSRRICRDNLRHTAPPWTPSYICITFNDSCFQQVTHTSALISPLVELPLTTSQIQLVDCPLEVLTPPSTSPDGSKHQQLVLSSPAETSMPYCMACKSSTRSTFACRTQGKHVFLPWNTVFVTVGAQRQVDDILYNNNRQPRQISNIIQQSQLQAFGIKGNDIPISENSDDIRNIQPSRTCLIEISCISISLQWLQVKTVPFTHGGSDTCNTAVVNTNPINAMSSIKKKKTSTGMNVSSMNDGQTNPSTGSSSLSLANQGPSQQQVKESHNFRHPIFIESQAKPNHATTFGEKKNTSMGMYLTSMNDGRESLSMLSSSSSLLKQQPHQHVVERHNYPQPVINEFSSYTDPVQSPLNSVPEDLRNKYAPSMTTLPTMSNHLLPSIIPDASVLPSRNIDFPFNRSSCITQFSNNSRMFPTVQPHSNNPVSFNPNMMVQGQLVMNTDPSLMARNHALNIHHESYLDNMAMQQRFLQEQNRKVQEGVTRVLLQNGQQYQQNLSLENPHVQSSSLTTQGVPITGWRTAIISNNALSRDPGILRRNIQGNSFSSELNTIDSLYVQQQQQAQQQSFLQHRLQALNSLAEMTNPPLGYISNQEYPDCKRFKKK